MTVQRGQEVKKTDRSIEEKNLLTNITPPRPHPKKKKKKRNMKKVSPFCLDLTDLKRADATF